MIQASQNELEVVSSDIINPNTTAVGRDRILHVILYDFHMILYGFHTILYGFHMILYGFHMILFIRFSYDFV